MIRELENSEIIFIELSFFVFLFSWVFFFSDFSFVVIECCGILISVLLLPLFHFLPLLLPYMASSGSGGFGGSSGSNSSSGRSAINNPLNPYFLHRLDSTCLILVSLLLIGDSHDFWTRAMTIALSIKNKLGFIDGLIPKSTSNDLSLLPTWIHYNNMVISWILNLVSKEISTSVIFTNSAHDIWLNLKDRFQQSNGPRIFQLHRELINLHQDQNSVGVYYTKLKAIWEVYMWRG